jgi:hypothetical protein
MQLGTNVKLPVASSSFHAAQQLREKPENTKPKLRKQSPEQKDIVEKIAVQTLKGFIPQMRK